MNNNLKDTVEMLCEMLDTSSKLIEKILNEDCTLDYDELRLEFERQHKGRNLKRHNLRGTYISATIAALWNQHIITATWLTGSPPRRK